MQTVLGPGLATLGQGVVGGDGTLVAWANQGLFAFRRATTVIADEGRVVEVDSAGFANWSSDLSYNVRRDPGSPTTTTVQVKPLERPTKVYKTGENEYVVVDTGGNRIVVLDKTAGEVRSIEKVALDATFRPSGWAEGDQLELRQPRDVAVWADYVPANQNPFTGPAPVGLEYWVHYLIADTGNKRLVEVVDRYLTVNDPQTGRPVITRPVRTAAGFNAFAQVIWHTPADISGKNWHYTAIQRFQVGIDNNNNALFVYASAIGDMMPTRINTGLDVPDATGDRQTGGGPGGILVFDAVSGQGNQVVNQVVMPDGSLKRLAGINSLAIRPIGFNGSLIDYAIMFTDRDGIFEIRRQGNQWIVFWFMSNAAYEAVRGVKLQAVSAKRLPNGNILMTNGYFGQTNLGGGFAGEVVQWRDDYNFGAPNLGFTTSSVRAELPPIVGTRGLRLPQFADRY
jgi:hypothetical protein